MSGPAAFAGLTAGPVPRAPDRQSTVLTLRPLLTPFKGRGRLFLRIEKMPQQASLSAGHRNSDGSWSLASDELEDLTYLVPPHAAGDHALTIRVTALDGGEATTLKVIDFPVSFRAVSAANEQPPAEQAEVPGSLAQSLFAAREAEIAQLRAVLEQERRESKRDAERIRQQLRRDFDQRFEEVASQHRQELEVQRAAFQTQIAELAARAPEPREKERDAELLRQGLQEEFDRRLETAAAEHRRQLDGERAGLQGEITGLTARAAALERRLREEQQSREAYAAQRAAQVEQELRTAYEEKLKSAQRQLEDVRQAAAAEGEAKLKSARERWNTDLAIAVQQAREGWDDEQAAAIWKLRDEHERHCNDLLAAHLERIAALELAKAAPQSGGHDAAALQSLNEQLSAAKRVLADCERELKDARAQLEQERAANGEQADQLLKRERAHWQAQEDVMREQMSALQTQIAALTARCREAEGRVNRSSWGTAIKDKARIHALTLEVASLRTALAKQADAVPAQDRAESALKAAYSKSTGQEEQQDAGRSKKSLLRDFCIAVCCITPLIVWYPQIRSFVHDFMSDDPPAAVPAAPPRPAAHQPVAKARMATVLRGVNMRQKPSAAADVVFTLKKGAKVEQLSTAGKWMEVGVTGPDGAVTRGWVFNTYLQAPP
jgi:hypothetical protein